jgi:hypothetical protein
MPQNTLLKILGINYIKNILTKKQQNEYYKINNQ